MRSITVQSIADPSDKIFPADEVTSVSCVPLIKTNVDGVAEMSQQVCRWHLTDSLGTLATRPLLGGKQTFRMRDLGSADPTWTFGVATSKKKAVLF
jgi:hypothetical protein